MHSNIAVPATPAGGPVTYQIFVKTLNGTTITLDVEASTTIGSIIAQLQVREGVPADQLRLMWGGLTLSEGQGRTLADYGIQRHSTLHMALRLFGGGKRAKVDYEQQAEKVRQDIQTTPDNNLNDVIRNIVGRFEGEGTEANFRAMLHSGDSPAAEAADEARIHQAIEHVEGAHRNLEARAHAYAFLVPAYVQLTQQIEQANHAKEQMEKALRYCEFLLRTFLFEKAMVW